jgi:Arc/MetJ-type ribon-helix-helix transcriptional regulator
MVKAQTEVKRRSRFGREPGPTEGVSIRLPLSWIDQIDDWRRKQKDLPTRPEAVRRMIELILDNHGKSKQAAR